jgi:hypothetical protein
MEKSGCCLPQATNPVLEARRERIVVVSTTSTPLKDLVLDIVKTALRRKNFKVLITSTKGWALKS